MESAKRSRPGAPQVKPTGEAHGNKAPFTPMPRGESPGAQVRTAAGVDHFSPEEKGTGKAC